MPTLVVNVLAWIGGATVACAVVAGVLIGPRVAREVAFRRRLAREQAADGAVTEDQLAFRRLLREHAEELFPEPKPDPESGLRKDGW